MKLSKILFSSAVLAALVFGFASCKEDEDEHDLLEVSGSTASVDYTNETTTMQRGFVSTRTNHRAAVAVFTIDTKASTKDAGNLGFLFDVVKTTASDHKTANDGVTVDTYSFGNVTVNYNGTNLRTYVSLFKGVATKDANGNSLLDDSSNFKGADGKVASASGNGVTSAKETECLKTWTSLSGIKADSNGLLKVAVVVTPVAPTSDDANGSYSVNFYDASSVLSSGSKSEPSSWVSSSAKSLASATVAASWTAKASTVESKLPQSLIAFYAAVKPTSTFVGNINLPYIQNEAEVIEWDDVQY